MIDTLVSARIPKAKKEAAAKLLASMGSTVSELINAAFDYVLSEKRLPARPSTKSEANADQSFAAFVEKSTLKIDWAESTHKQSYKEIIAQGKAHDYESLA